MKREIGVERTYPLGQYKNIKLRDYIHTESTSIELSGKNAFNKELIDNIRFLQLVQLEVDYRRYLEMARKAGELPFEDAMEMLENIRIDLLDEIKEHIKNGEELND